MRSTAETFKHRSAPKDYLACIAYIQQLVEQGEFELIAEESTCPLEKVKNETGWADEVMPPCIRCKHCGQVSPVWSTPGEAGNIQKRQRMTQKRR